MKEVNDYLQRKHKHKVEDYFSLDEEDKMVIANAVASQHSIVFDQEPTNIDFYMRTLLQYIKHAESNEAYESCDITTRVYNILYKKYLM